MSSNATTPSPRREPRPIVLKKLEDQVLVVTGASSGIGLATARLAAERGARVVIAARDEPALNACREKLAADGGEVASFVADVADAEAMKRLAAHALETFGAIDTWVNNAGVSVYGRVEEVTLEDMRRVLDVTFFGVVHGTRAALPHLRRTGGALINVGSVESELAIPLNGAYAAAKHAVKGFTDVLRMELLQEGAPISVTLVKPGSIDTPFFEHAANYMEGDPTPPPPVYSPETVAETILCCAERPVRDIVVGGVGRMQIGMTRMFPRLSERLFSGLLVRAQQREPRSERSLDGSLYRPRGTHGQERGDYEGHVMRSSAYTTLALHPVRTALGGLALWAGLRALGRRRSRWR